MTWLDVGIDFLPEGVLCEYRFVIISVQYLNSDGDFLRSGVVFPAVCGYDLEIVDVLALSIEQSGKMIVSRVCMRTKIVFFL